MGRTFGNPSQRPNNSFKPTPRRGAVLTQVPGRTCLCGSVETNMPKFITIGYGDSEGYERTSFAVRDAAHANDETLRQAGALMGIAGKPVQDRNHEVKHEQVLFCCFFFFF